MARYYLHQLKSGLKLIFNLFFPKACVSCNKRLDFSENILCNDCYNHLILLKKHISNEWEIEEICFDKVYSCFFYDDVVRDLVHCFKYQEYKHLAQFIAEIMKDNLQLNHRFSYDFVIPVPLHHIKKKERGYNQAELLTGCLSKLYNLNFNNKLIYRNRYTETQTLKTHSERKHNMENAFSINKKIKTEGKKILIIDDVITTGSTVNTIARMLKHNGAKTVDIMTFAFANV